MKKLLFLISFVALSFNVFALDEPVYAPKSLTVPTVTSGSTSNSIAAGIDCRKQDNVTIQWVVNGGTALLAGTNLVANFGASVDGTSYSTNAYAILINLTTAPNGVFVTNLVVNGSGYLRLDSVTATGIIMTNVVKYGLKIP